jgi:D-alanine-D-alanine ligase
LKKTIAVIFGGAGLENEISVKSAESIIDALDKKLYTPLPIYIDKDGTWRLAEPRLIGTNGSVLPEAYPVRLDGESGFLVLGRVIVTYLAIIALHGNLGEDGVIQGALLSAKIPYLGQSVLASALTNDKASTKTVAKSLGVPTADWILLTGESPANALALTKQKLSYPIFLKACSFGSSHGTYKIESDLDFTESYEKIRALGEGRIIAEEYIEADFELECAYLDIGTEYYLPFGIVHSGGKFYSYEEKYKADSVFRASLGTIPRKSHNKIIEYSRLIKEAAGIRYIARFDFFVKGDSVIFNEINAFPGMTKTSLFPKMIDENVLPFSECLTRLIEYSCHAQ